MTAWYGITEAETDPGAPPKSELWKAWWKNPIAISEGSTNSPIAQAAWHPYDAVTVGDGADGVLFDRDVDGTGVTTITTPNFAAGYDYMLVAYGLSVVTASATQFLISLERGGSFRTAANISAAENNIGTDVVLRVPIFAPMVAGPIHGGVAEYHNGALSSSLFSWRQTGGGVTTATRARLSNGSPANAFDAGKVYLLRRRNFFF